MNFLHWRKIDSNGDTSGLLSYYSMQHCREYGLYGYYGGTDIRNYGDINSYKKDYRNRNRSMSNLHIIFLQDLFIVFRSDLNPDVFDFDNELLRSVVS